MFPARILLVAALFAATVSARSLLVLPVSGEGVSAGDMATVNRLFQDAIADRRPDLAVGKEPCADRACALEAARAASADEVIHGSLHQLGSRWIFTAAVVNADGTGAFSQRLTAVSIEDMEALTVRMADALAQRRATEQVASLDNITARESGQEPERRRSLYSSGVSLGYLFPVGGSFSYVNHDSLGPDRRHAYDQMIRVVWLNTWDFRNDLSLGAEVVWSSPYAIGADLNLRYLFNRGDVSPFVGGGLGLHYVKSDEGPGVPSGKRNSGPALNAQGGLMLFRTYDVNVMLRGQYQVIFNTDIDHGPSVDVGVSFRSKDASKGGAAADKGLGFWGYAGVALLTLVILGALAE